MINLVNYILKFAIIAFGLVIFFNVVELDMPETTRQVVGVVVILFGVYRLILFKSKMKKYEFEAEEDNEN